MDQTADYVVAGAGSAGCVLAKRLAEAGASVILVEAGGPDRGGVDGWLVRKPGMIAIFHNVPRLKKRLDWGYYTVPQKYAMERSIPQPRGRVLGGSGSINGMLFVRGNAKNFDDWAADGCPGWAYQDVLPSFKRMENWEDGRATGVEVQGSDNSKKMMRAGREVILSAGAFGSAQLLMLSGVGPAAHLRSFGIEVVADLPVGDNLHDHMFVPMTYVMKNAVHRSTSSYFFRGMLMERVRGDTWMGRTVFEAAGWVRSSIAGRIPDIQIHSLPWSYPFPNQDSPARQQVDPRAALTIMSTLIYPKSRGTLRLASASVRDAPLIDFGYLSEPDDTTVLLDGMELIREAMASKLIASGVDLELSPGTQYKDRAALAAEVPNRATSVYHAVGSCRMGSDERAVVDPMLKVRGVEGLRVADASIMPSITGGNTNVPAMMIGEHAAQLILSSL